MKALHDANMMNSTAIAPPQDNLFIELDAIIPDEVPLDKNWESIEHSLLDDNHTCPKFLWTNDPPIPE